jgi:putative ABC transport system permease protein
MLLRLKGLSRAFRPAQVPRVASLALLALGAPTAAAESEEARVPPILVTRQLAAARGIVTGQVIRLSARADGRDTRPFRVAGVYEPTPDPMRLTALRHEVRLHLHDLLALTAGGSDPESAESVDRINVALTDPAEALSFARELSARMPGLVARPTAPEGDAEAGVFVALKRFHLAIAIVTVVGSSMFLLALMVMRADERREVVGILRLVGFSRPRILVQVLVEGLLVAFAGAVFGVAFAAATEGLVNTFFQHHYDTALVFLRVTPAIALRCVALAVPLGVAAGLVACWTLLRRDIVALLRR